MMKTIGLIGGMSWESSIEYYRIINEAVRAKLGGFHSAKCMKLGPEQKITLSQSVGYPKK
jgi:aspartate/glutamate racemase